MKIEDDALMNFLWSWEVMRRIGFRSEEIMMAVVPPGGRVQMDPSSPVVIADRAWIALEVKRHGRSFRWVIGPSSIPDSNLDQAYDDAVRAWNTGSLEGTDMASFKASAAFKQSTEVLIKLYQKGLLP